MNTHLIAAAVDIAAERALIYSLFGVYYRIIRIRGEAHLRQTHMGGIVIYAAPAAFLIAAEYQPDVLFGLRAGLRIGRQSIYRGHQRTLVVAYSAGPYNAVFLICVKGRIGPALSAGHNIKVRKHAYLLPGAARYFGIAGIAVHIHRMQPQLSAHLQRRVQRPSYLAAEGCAGLRLPLDGGYPEQGLKVGHHGVPVLINIFMHIHNIILSGVSAIKALRFLCVRAVICSRFLPAGSGARKNPQAPQALHRVRPPFLKQLRIYTCCFPRCRPYTPKRHPPCRLNLCRL